MKLLPQALRENWSARRLAKEADTTIVIASDMLAKTSDQMQSNLNKVMNVETQKLAQEARKARTSALARLENLGKAVDSVADALQAKGEAASAKDVKEAVAAAAQLWRHVESLTGLDVAKAAAAKQAAAQDGTPTAWDGCAALEASPVSTD